MNYELKFFEKLQSYFFYTKVKETFDVINEDSDIEKVYYKDNKLVVDVIDTTIGEQIYEIVSVLTNKGIINTRNASFKIDRVSLDKQKRVQWFSVDVQLQKKWKLLSALERLIEFVSFAEDMNEKGFVIDRSKYNYSKCEHISEILSLFIQKDDSGYNWAECVIEHVHSTFTEGISLKYFYDMRNPYLLLKEF